LVLLQQHGTNVHLFRGVEAPPAPRPPPPAAATCRQLPPAAASCRPTTASRLSGRLSPSQASI